MLHYNCGYIVLTLSIPYLTKTKAEIYPDLLMQSRLRIWYIFTHSLSLFLCWGYLRLRWLEYSFFSFIVAVFLKGCCNTELMNTKPLLLGEFQRQVLKRFCSLIFANQLMWILLYVCLLEDSVIYPLDSWTLKKLMLEWNFSNTCIFCIGSPCILKY